MIWTDNVQGEKPELERAIGTPIGAISPLWLAFAGAASVGVAYWWLTRWMRPVNIEAAGAMPVEMTAPPALEEAAAAYDLSPEAIEDVVDTPPTEETGESLLEMADAGGDDLTRLIGVGPKLAHALADHGVNSFAQIAEWTEDDLAFFDRELNLKGRAVRDGWIEQAKSMGEETTPALPE